MKKSLFRNLMLLMLALSIFSCGDREEIDIDEPTEIEIEIPDHNIVSSVYGRVIDENDNPVANTIVFLKNEMSETDDDGFFFFNDKNMNAYGQLIKFEKTGYFLGAKTFEPTTGVRSFVECKLMTKTLSGSISTSTGGEVNSNGNSSVKFTANSFVDANGAAYSGEVKVYSRWMDPTAQATTLEMPGDLRAVDQTSTIVQLATYGMMAVELEGTGGQELNLAQNMVAELRFEVPASLLSNAPATIPLWSFNEELGYWIEEGTATLVGDQYVGNVSHFSFWNCDAPFPLVELSGVVKNQNGILLEDYKVTVELASGTLGGCVWTDARGNFNGKIPLGEVLIIKVYDQCGVEVYSAQIGPFTVDTILPPIIVPANSNGNFLVHGYLNDCTGQVVTNGYVKLKFSNQVSQIIYVDAVGYFSKLVNGCSATSFDYQGVDLGTSAQSSWATATISTGDIDLGTITTCDALENYFNYTFGASTEDMDEAFLQIVADSSGLESLYISGINSSVQGYSTIQVYPNSGVGTYNPEYIILFNALGEAIVCNAGSSTDCSDVNIVFTELDLVTDGKVEATFSGTADLNGIVTPISGSFKGSIK